MKNFLSILLVLAIVSGLICVSTAQISAASTTAFDILTTSNYAKTYTIASKGITIPYTNTKLTKRGSITYGRSSTAYIDNKTDELYLCDVGKNSRGVYWAKISYPIGSKRAYAYIALSAITSNNSSHKKATSSGKFYCSYRKGASTSSSYYVDKKDTVYLIATSGSNYQILYPISNGKWRIGWCSKSNYNKYCVKTTSYAPQNNKIVKSNKISFKYSSNKTDYTTSNATDLKVNGTAITVGSICYTYTYNGRYKTTSYYSGYTYIKHKNKYINMNGWQCCAYARYIQYLLYGSQEFRNSKFVDVVGASGKTATAANMKNWVNQAGIGAHIRSKRPHSLVVIGIDKNGFYYTDSNVKAPNQIRVGYYTWNDFANSNYKNIEYICYYKG